MIEEMQFFKGTAEPEVAPEPPPPPPTLAEMVTKFESLRVNIPIAEAERQRAEDKVEKMREELGALKMRIAEEIGISIDDFDD